MTSQDTTATGASGKRHFFGYVAALLVALFILFCAVGYIIGYSPLFENLIHAEARLFIKDVLFAIGTACLISLLFGLLLELPETSDFVAKKLSDLIFGEEYLRRIAPSLPLVRRQIDRVLFGEAELASRYSLYNFMEDRLQDLYRVSFRRNFSAEFRCTLEKDDLLLWTRRTNYTYVRNRLDPSEAVIPSLSSLDIPAAWLPKTNEKKDQAEAFNRIVRRLAVKVGSCQYERSDPARMALRCEDASRSKMPSEIEIEHNFNDGKLNFWFECKPPLEMLRKELHVEIIYETFTLRNAGNLLFVSVAGPTEDYALDCYFPDNTRLEAARFYWRGIPAMADLRTEYGAISVKIPGWLLQGEGGCVAWFLPQSALPAQVVTSVAPSMTRT
jgi:hypothetical protein